MSSVASINALISGLVDTFTQPKASRESSSSDESVTDEVTISNEGADRSQNGSALGIGSKFQLSEAGQREVEELQARDRKVRAHERAHQAAAGELAIGGAAYEYQTGPDGRQYAVGGEVEIDTSSVEGDPEATLGKAERIRRAALSPADPSPQDRRVAAEAAAMAAKARQELSSHENEDDSNFRANKFTLDLLV